MILVNGEKDQSGADTSQNSSPRRARSLVSSVFCGPELYWECRLKLTLQIRQHHRVGGAVICFGRVPVGVCMHACVGCDMGEKT